MRGHRLFLALLLALGLGSGVTLAQPFTAQIQLALQTLGLWPLGGAYATGTVPTWNATTNTFVPASGGTVGFPATDTYFARQTVPILGIDVFGGYLFLVDSNGASGVAFGASSNPDAWFVHEATGVIAQRHGSNAMEERIYGRDDFSVEKVYERWYTRFTGGEFRIGTEFKTNPASPGQPYTARNLTIALGNASGTDPLTMWTWNATTGDYYPAFGGFFSVGAAANHVLNTYTNNLQGGSTKTLTESSATGYVTLTVPSSGAIAGRIEYTVFAADATNTQTKTGQLFFSAVANSSGTVTNASVSDVNTLNPTSSGTLTNTMDATTAANAVTIRANAASSLTQTTLQIQYRVVLFGRDGTITGL